MTSDQSDEAPMGHLALELPIKRAGRSRHQPSGFCCRERARPGLHSGVMEACSRRTSTTP